jgi:hypothetical protein
LQLGFEWNSDLDIIEMLLDGRRYSISCFKEVLIIGSWAIWNHRNKHIFYGAPINHRECFRFFREDFMMIMQKAKPSLKEGMKQWLDTL